MKTTLSHVMTGRGGWRGMLPALAGILLVMTLSACTNMPYSYTATRYPLVVSSIASDIAKRMEEKSSTAASFAMSENGEIFCTGAFGWRDKAADIPTTNETLFNFGSCAKVITSAAMMKLVDQGVIHLDDKVVDLVPEFQMADERAAGITVQMLLNHSAGFPGTTGRASSSVAPLHAEHMQIILDNLAQDRLKADPGAFGVYCNDCFSMAEIVIAHVSGKPFAQYVKDEIFTPLGMNHAQTADEPYAEGSRVAYRDGIRGSEFEIMNVYGSGGFNITASDWCRFLDMLAGGGISSSGVRILSEESAAVMAVDQTATNFWLSSNKGFGLGWDMVKHPTFEALGVDVLSKSGGTGYYTSHVLAVPAYKLCVAISCAGTDLGVADVAVLAIADILKRKGVIDGITDWEGHAAQAAFPAAQRANAGYYGCGALLRVDFSEEDTMRLSIWENAQWKTLNEGLTWRENGRFAIDGTAEEFYFEDVPGHGTYLMHAMQDVTGKSPVSTSPVAQKLAPADVSGNAVAAWQQRAGTWILINMHPQSLDLNSPIRSFETFNELNGILVVGGKALQIYDAQEARMFMQIPFNPGRDMNDAQVRTINGEECIRLGDAIVQPISRVPDFLTNASETITIGTEGFSEWRHAGASAATFTVAATGTQARWGVYDSNYTLTADSLHENTSSITVPAGGYVQFLGESGASFNVTPVMGLDK